MAAIQQLMAAQKIAASSVTWLLGPEGFEGTGTPSGFTGGAGIDFDSTTSPIAGAQSLAIATGYNGTAGSFTASSEVWWRFKVRFNLAQGDIGQLELYNDTTVLVSINHDGTGNFTLTCGSASVSGSGLSAATNLRILVRYVKATVAGNDAIAQVWISNTDTFPGSPTASITTGTMTLDCDNIWAMSTAHISLVLDDCGVATTNPGNF